MVNYFEEITAELNDYEKETVVPVIVDELTFRVGKKRGIKNAELRAFLSEKNIKVAESRIRKLVQYIRVTGLVECLMGTNSGYYISDNKEELDKYVESLHQRANATYFTANQIQYQIDKNFRNR